MFWLFYNLVFGLFFGLMLPYFYFRMRRRGGYRRNFMQRIGRYADTLEKSLESGSRPVWIHAVSVGELQIALKFMNQWREKNSQERFVLSLTTSTAHAIAEKQLHADDQLIYFPVDAPWVLRRVLKVLRPRALILVEAEIWPNLVRMLNKKSVPCVLINGRLSNRSYGRMQKARFLTRRVLPMMDLLCMQSEEEQRRMIELGAPAEKVCTLPSMKYEVVERNPEREADAHAALQAAGITPEHTVLFAGSTWPGEEAILVDLFRRLREKFPDFRLVLVPRHVERIPALLQELDLSGLSVARRSEPDETTSADIFLLDTTGELKDFYSVADIIFVGKSLCDTGGQNIMEPAIFGKAILVGPNMQNFPVVMKDFLAAKAILQVPDAAKLEQAVEQLLADPTHGSACGEAASQLMSDKSGALTDTIDLLAPLLLSRAEPTKEAV